MIRKKIILTLIGATLGAVGGYMYYYLIGCRGGSCPITSNPYISTIYGLVIGSLILNMFNGSKTDSGK
ncbi:MAG: DUF6132 family protein [Ignavibacteria bacterium]|nr:DUF6132 family protein [Ignavibacteria bacterium]